MVDLPADIRESNPQYRRSQKNLAIFRNRSGMEVQMTGLRQMRIAFLLITCPAYLIACSGFVEVPSQNHNSRIGYLVIHHTSEDFAESLRLLTQPTDRPVSVHYMIPETGDATYEGRSLKVYRLVQEDRRAWHAGRSYWHEKEGLNDQSIGIELVNKTYCETVDPNIVEASIANQVCHFLPYPDEQIALLINLAREILDRYPDIDPVDVVGHADIAPTRKVDPGPLFPWKLLYEAGIGAWYDDETLAAYKEHFRNGLPSINTLQRALGHYGYQTSESGEWDTQTKWVIRVFQMHFRPSGISGEIDAETAAILFALLEKYRPDSLEDLIEDKSSERQGEVSDSQ
jgi:N-acetyl-anhydromuramyl-L-alanine amidase AmpD